MEVLECDREGCNNIMCQRLSDVHGYICHDCFEELIDYLKTANVINDDVIRSFMKSPKQVNKFDNSKAIEEFVDQVFPLMDGM